MRISDWSADVCSFRSRQYSLRRRTRVTSRTPAQSAHHPRMARSYLARRTDLAFRPLFFMSLIGFKHAPAAVAFGPAVRNRPALLLARGFLGRRVDDASASERSEEHTSALQSLMPNYYAVFLL